MELQAQGPHKQLTELVVSRSSQENSSAPRFNGPSSNQRQPFQVLDRNTPEQGPVTQEQQMRGRIQFLTLCWTLFLEGWNDGTTGPLLPRLQHVYHADLTIISLIFVFACLGFIIGVLANIPLTDKLGFGKTIVLGSICQILGYAIQSAAPPFPVFVLAYTINGVGLALQNAQANGFVGTLKSQPESKMGMLHAAYGLGAFASPLVATQFARLPRWSFHFLVSLGIAISNTVILVCVFKLQKQDDCMREAGETVIERTQTMEENTFRQVMRTRVVHIFAVFILVYVGVEVTMGGWVVTYIIDVRGGGPSAGYISSGFFGGLTVGRLALLWVNRKIGERYVMFIYTAIGLALEIVIWLVPSLIGNALAIAIVGVLLGPMYPIVMNQSSRILPRWILTGSIGWIAGFGQAGSALFPFGTGVISTKYGIKSLQPMLVSMMAFMIALWAFVPKAARRPD